MSTSNRLIDAMIHRGYRVRDRAYLLRNSEVYSLTKVGKFRVIAPRDLAKYTYGGDRQRMETDVRRLVREGLLVTKPASDLP